MQSLLNFLNLLLLHFDRLINAFPVFHILHFVVCAWNRLVLLNMIHSWLALWIWSYMVEVKCRNQVYLVFTCLPEVARIDLRQLKRFWMSNLPTFARRDNSARLINAFWFWVENPTNSVSLNCSKIVVPCALDGLSLCDAVTSLDTLTLEKLRWLLAVVAASAITATFVA